MKKRYSDLEDLLFKGFIPLKLNVSGVNLVLKTVNEHEYERIKLMSGMEGSPQYVTYFNINYLYYSIYMVDGMNILKDRENSYFDFFEILKQFPSSFFKQTIPIFESFTKKMSDCSILLEQYLFEPESRYYWESKKSYLLNEPKQTSISGTDLLGLNQYQKYWTTLNIREDKKDKFEQDYSLFKFLASFQDPKAVRKIDQMDKVKKEEEDKKRERLRVMGTEEEIKYLSSPTDTREGIIEALEKQMRGEKDEHDILIEQYEKAIRKDMLKRMSDLNKIREDRRKDLDDISDEVRVISKDELEERMAMIQKRKDMGDSSPEVSMEQRSKFYQMSNVQDGNLIKEENFLSEEDYSRLSEDDTYQVLSGKKVYDEDKKVEQDYLKQQKKLAEKHNLEEEIFKR